MKTKLFTFAVVVFLLAAATAYAAPAWVSLEPLPEARVGGAYVADGTYLYYIGGGIDWISGVDAEVFRYDPTGDSWDEMEPMPEGLGQLDAGYIDGKIYVPGGYLEPSLCSATLHIYDISTDTWSTGADVPNSDGLEGYAVEAYDGLLYMFGGYDYAIGDWAQTLYVYDPVADSWDTLDDMTSGGWELSAWAYEGMLYAAGGNSDVKDTALAEAYSISGDSWSDAAMTDLGVTEVGGADAVGGDSGDGLLFLIGGYDNSDAVWIYNSGTDTWSAGTSLPDDNDYGEADCLDGKIYLAGGASDGESPSTTHLVYDFGGDCPSRYTTTTVTTTTTTTTVPADDDSADDTTTDDTTADDTVADDATDDAADDAADDTDDDTVPATGGGGGDDDDDGGCCG